MSLVFATSTPKQREASAVLRSKKWSNIIGSDEEEEIEKIKFQDGRSKQKSKENRPRHRHNNKTRKQKSYNGSGKIDDPLKKRRIQAVEAMQIAEQRRLRLSISDDEEKLSESFQQVHLDNSEFLPDGRLRLTKKQLIARRIKHSRIQECLIEQEARNKNKNLVYKTVTFRNPVAEWTPRPKSDFSYTRDVFHYKRNRLNTNLPKINEIDENISANITTATATAEVEEIKERPDRKIIRYTKEQIRELNPYGVYFM